MGELCISGGLTIKNEADDLKSLHGMAEIAQVGRRRVSAVRALYYYLKIKLYMKRGDI